MKLIDHLKQLDIQARDAFAASCETSPGHLRNVAYGYRRCGPELAALIEFHSHGQVTRRELCPDNWRIVWPELAATLAPAGSDIATAAAGEGA
ncbi:MAG: hypothetical protein A2486_16155 [Burkholderiales bacterium RIFOXYC12_FULL_65_23]|uniref:hypothetical protein n=1 Tax=Malikia spinosa TaxID=86180 RepID=UPI0008CB35E2|nr:MAG: hypothetical protein A2486_16155 [Burkholderiales bacterium RIFOXYC12_FULL_65_23]